MKETRVFNLIILDESGSMCAIKGEAISSVNESIQTIRCAEKENENQKHFVSLVTFNQKARTVYDCEPVSEIREMTSDDYHPDCCTALFDAMGYALTRLAVKVKDNPFVWPISTGDDHFGNVLHVCRRREANSYLCGHQRFDSH